MNLAIILVVCGIFLGLAGLGVVAYLLSAPRPPMFEGDGDDE